MNISSVSFVPLKQANLCVDCDMITAINTRCPACGSIALLNLDRALARSGYCGLNYPSDATVSTISDHRVRQGDFVHST
jgi:hypothetical protein